MKKTPFFPLLILSFFSLLSFAPPSIHTTDGPCARCSAEIEEIDFIDLPYFEQADWYSSWDPWYGNHSTSNIEFSDGYRGKIFRGGRSGKYFIGNSDGGKFYYINQESTVRALYLYKKYACISGKYRR